MQPKHKVHLRLTGIPGGTNISAFDRDESFGAPLLSALANQFHAEPSCLTLIASEDLFFFFGQTHQIDIAPLIPSKTASSAVRGLRQSPIRTGIMPRATRASSKSAFLRGA
jgi:hypothetical protein